MKRISCISCRNRTTASSSSSSSDSNSIKYIREQIEKYGIPDTSRHDEKCSMILNNIFAKIVNLKQLKEAYIAFLQGKVFCTPTHLGPIDPETISLVSKLVQIVQKGFISTEGQPSISCQYTEFQSRKEITKEWQQKSYIMGLVDKKYIDTIVAKVKQSKYFYCKVETYEDDVPILSYYSFPTKSYNVTRYRTLGEASWNKYTFVTSDVEDVAYHFRKFPKLSHIIESRMAYVTIAYNKWPNETTHPQNVEDFLLSIMSSAHKI